MLSEPRAIFFETRIGWPPSEVIPFRVNKRLVRGLYNKLCDIEFDEFSYDNIEFDASSRLLSFKHEGGGISRCSIADEHLSITEEWTESGIDDFLRRIHAVCTAFYLVCKQQVTILPPVFTQRCKIHCLAQPNEASGALELLANRIASVGDKIVHFDRPPAFFGVRFRFPPVIMEIDEGEDEEFPDFCTVRFETHSEDPKQVWMEVATTRLFESAVDLSDQKGIQQIESGMQAAYDFLAENCKQFLDQFDDHRPDELDQGEENNDNSTT